MRAGAVASIIAAIISTGGAFGSYMYFRPYNLEGYLRWKGYSLAKEDDSNFWKAIYGENEDIFANDFKNVKQEETEKWKVIKEYCTKALKKQDYTPEIDKALKYCIDEIRTVKGQLVREEKGLKDLMNDPKQYKVATAVQGNQDFWTLLNASNKDFEERTKAYEDWCKESLNTKPTKGLVGNVHTFCRKKPYSNFQEKLKSDGYVGLTKQQMREQYEKLGIDKLKKGGTSRYLLEIFGGPEKLEEAYQKWGRDSVDKQAFGDRYIFYCDQTDRLAVDKEDYADKYSKYLGICAVKDEKVKP